MTDTRRKSGRPISLAVPVALLILAALVFMGFLAKPYLMSNHKSSEGPMSSTNSSASSTSASIIPRSVIFGNPDRARVMVSPDGRYISYVAPHHGVLNIHLVANTLSQDVEAGDVPGSSATTTTTSTNSATTAIASARPLTASRSRPITQYGWTQDSRYVFYLLDEEGDENHSIYLVDVASGEVKTTVSKPGVKHYIAATSKDQPETIIYASNERRKDLFDLYKLDTKSGKTGLWQQNDQYSSLTLDHQLKLRFGTIELDNGGTRLERFVAEAAAASGNGNDNQTKDNITSLPPAQPFMEIAPEDVNTTGIVAFDADPSRFYLIDSKDRNTAGLYLHDLNTGQRQLIFADERSDDISVALHPSERRLLYISSIYARKKTQLHDQSLAADFERLQALIGHNVDIQITSASNDYRYWIVAAMTDSYPVRYYIYDRQTTEAQFLFVNSEAMAAHKMLPMYPVAIKARDGLDLISYLTLPEHSQAEITIDNEEDKIATAIRVKNAVPLVLYVHGGPTARDYWGLDPAAQWLANRGYGVLSVNYRGSTGFGKDFINAGNGQWGAKMHDDLVDAVEWAVEHGIAQRDRVAIFGGSYGGYAALVGLTFTPNLFACGVDVVGPSSLVTLLNSIPPYWKPMLNQLKVRIGAGTETEEGRAFLQSRSPLYHVDKVIRPLLIAHGANDPRVKQAESEQLVDALKARGIPATYVLYPDEGHGFARPENRLAFYGIAEKFLAQCLGNHDRVEEIDKATISASSAQIVQGAELVLPPTQQP